MNKKLESEKIDISLPSVKIPVGAPNILEKIVEEIEELLMSMGYDVVDGPEIEEDKFNFEMLNIPKGHPARDAQDTFYIKDEEIPCAGCGEWVLIDVPGVSLDEIFPIHKAEEVLQFGKYKGKSLGDIYTTDYQYLYWLETTDRFFKIDFEELEQLYPNIGKPSDISISERIIGFGKYKGKKFSEIKDDISYLEWLASIGKISNDDFNSLTAI